MRHLAAVVLTLCALARLLGHKVPIVPARGRFNPVTAGNGASWPRLHRMLLPGTQNWFPA